MSKDSTIVQIKQPVTFESVEAVIRSRIQVWMQEFLGRAKSERKKDVDASPGYRNGHGKARKLTLSFGDCGIAPTQGTGFGGVV